MASTAVVPHMGNELVEANQAARLPAIPQQEEPMSLAATHPNLLPTVIQSDIKHNLDSLVSQLCNLRLGTNQHQRLLLLRQRQLIEEDELRLKHYVEYEKFQKALRQANDVHTAQQQYLYIQPTAINQQGYLNFGNGLVPSLNHTPNAAPGVQAVPQQQQIISANTQTTAVSASVQGYAVMLNPQINMQPSQQQQQQQQQQATATAIQMQTTKMQQIHHQQQFVPQQTTTNTDLTLINQPMQQLTQLQPQPQHQPIQQQQQFHQHLQQHQQQH
ncbi:nuclear transcription factor Y subunit beta-like [Musca domestica]|uniref:Nuclear transcription factor Y subunit beta-like n=1 Tax=Musca domestica TaxID=7370 RepID=A0ABM3UP81_MUSDO|nr:nuclear transcription factor Y subunit beta-like [Musca domestica]